MDMTAPGMDMTKTCAGIFSCAAGCVQTSPTPLQCAQQCAAGASPTSTAAMNFIAVVTCIETACGVPDGGADVAPFDQCAGKAVGSTGACASQVAACMGS